MLEQLVQDDKLPWGANTILAATIGGHLHILQNLYARYPQQWNGDLVATIAAVNEHLSILEWIRRENIPADTNEVSGTGAANGHWGSFGMPKRLAIHLPIDGREGCWGWLPATAISN